MGAKTSSGSSASPLMRFWRSGRALAWSLVLTGSRSNRGSRRSRDEPPNAANSTHNPSPTTRPLGFASWGPFRAQMLDPWKTKPQVRLRICWTPCLGAQMLYPSTRPKTPQKLPDKQNPRSGCADVVPPAKWACADVVPLVRRCCTPRAQMLYPIVELSTIKTPGRAVFSVSKRGALLNT